MSETTNTYPHEDLIKDNQVNVAELPAKTQALMTKFKAETDSDKKDSLDESLYGQIEDFIEDKKAKMKDEANKVKVAAHKEKKAKEKIDVSNAPTANAQAQAQEKPAEPQPRSVTRTILGY